MAALPDAGKGVGAHREDGTKEKSQAATLPPAIPASIARNAPLAISSWSNRSARSLPALKLLPRSAKPGSTLLKKFQKTEKFGLLRA